MVVPGSELAVDDIAVFMHRRLGVTQLPVSSAWVREAAEPVMAALSGLCATSIYGVAQMASTTSA